MVIPWIQFNFRRVLAVLAHAHLLLALSNYADHSGGHRTVLEVAVQKELICAGYDYPSITKGFSSWFVCFTLYVLN